MFYLDCFCFGSCLGSEVPTHTFNHPDPAKLTTAGAEMLKNLSFNVDEVRVGRVAVGKEILLLNGDWRKRFVDYAPCGLVEV